MADENVKDWGEYVEAAKQHHNVFEKSDGLKKPGTVYVTLVGKFAVPDGKKKHSTGIYASIENGLTGSPDTLYAFTMFGKTAPALTDRVKQLNSKQGRLMRLNPGVTAEYYSVHSTSGVTAAKTPNLCSFKLQAEDPKQFLEVGVECPAIRYKDTPTSDIKYVKTSPVFVNFLGRVIARLSRRRDIAAFMGSDSRIVLITRSRFLPDPFKALDDGELVLFPNLRVVNEVDGVLHLVQGEVDEIRSPADAHCTEDSGLTAFPSADKITQPMRDEAGMLLTQFAAEKRARDLGPLCEIPGHIKDFRDPTKPLALVPQLGRILQTMTRDGGASQFPVGQVVLEDFPRHQFEIPQYYDKCIACNRKVQPVENNQGEVEKTACPSCNAELKEPAKLNATRDGIVCEDGFGVQVNTKLKMRDVGGPTTAWWDITTEELAGTLLGLPYDATDEAIVLMMMTGAYNKKIRDLLPRPEDDIGEDDIEIGHYQVVVRVANIIAPKKQKDGKNTYYYNVSMVEMVALKKKDFKTSTSRVTIDQ